MTGVIVDGAGFTSAQVRALIRERHQLASDLAVALHTLRLRSDALNRVAAENDRLRLRHSA